MKKIFVTIPWFLPAFRAGGPVQSVANLAKEFQKDVQYYIFCSDTDLNGAALENIKRGEWIHYNGNTKVWYAGHQKISESLVKQTEEIRPDVLYIIGLYSWHFSTVPLVYCKAAKKIISTKGMLHPGALSQKKWKKKIYLRLFKLLDYHHKVSFHATDEEEKIYIRKYFGKDTLISIAGNFPNKLTLLPVIKKEPGSLKMVSIALISPMKNIMNVLKALGQIGVSIQYDIYGPVKDHEYWRLCKEQIKGLPENVHVTWHGELIPSGVQEVLSQAHIFILPSKSENFGHAFYEALSAGRPVITSNFTPWQSLISAKAGINVPIEGVKELSDAILFFAEMTQQELEEWSRGSRHYAEKAVDVEKIRGEYKEMFF